MRRRAPRRRSLVTPVAVGLATALVALANLPGSVADASTVSATRPSAGLSTPAVSINSGGVNLTAGHTTWRLTVDAFGTSGGMTVAAGLAHAAASGSAEEHLWSVSGLPASTVTQLSSTSWLIKPPATKVAPIFKALKLTFNATSHKSVACSSGSETLYYGSLKGALKLVTGFSLLGTVGGTSLSFSVLNVAAVDHGCKSLPTCGTALTWFLAPPGSSGALIVTGITSKGIDDISLARSTKLSHPANAARTDVAAATAPPAVLSGGTLSVTTKAGSIVTGSATLTTEYNAPPQTGTCYLNGVAHTETTTTSLASFTSSLQGRLLVGGNISSAPSGTTAAILQVSFS